MNLFKFFQILVFISGSVVGFAQVPHFESYSLSKRNNPVSINKIFQDKRDFVWFATNKGLYRFDGRNFRIFSRADSLPDVNVTAIGQDSLGRIWTGHQNGEIAFLNGQRFQRVEMKEGPAAAPVSDIVFDRQGLLWFSTFNDGLYYFSEKQQRLFRLDDAEGLPDLFIYDLEVDSTGRVWAGTDGGIAICNLRDSNPVIEVINGRSGLPDNIVKKIVFEGHHTVYLGTEDSGVIEYDTQTKKYSPLTDEWPYGSITDIVRKDQQLWIGSTKDGLRMYEKRTRILRSYDAGEGRMPGMTAMLTDDEGNIWCGTRGGVLRTPGNTLEFLNVNGDERFTDILAAAKGVNGEIWYSDVTGLHRRRMKDGKTITDNILEKTAYKNFRVISLFIDANGSVWAGLYGEGVLRISPDGKIRYLNKELRNGNVLSISGKDDHVWLATLGGATRIDVSGDRLSIENFDRNNGLASDFIYQVFEDSKSRVWFATDGKGVDMLDEKGLHHFQQGLPSLVVYGFAEDKKGDIWVNMQEGGVFRWTGNSFTPLQATLRSENISALTTDPEKNQLVIAHDLGLDVYDIETSHLTSFGDEAGLQDHVVNLNAVQVTAKEILFGTTAGIVLYTPEEKHAYVPRVFIESIKVNGKNMSLSGDMTFSYDQNDLSINFLGFWYRDPSNVKFQYKMENYDPDFITTVDNNVTYSKLPPGEYSFSVNSFVNGKPGPQKASILNFRIRPPFWRTTSFYIVALIVGGLSAYGVVRYREKKLIEDKLLLEEKVEERTREIQRQNEEIQAQNEEILAQAEEIKGINENLEMLVQQRTLELERKNKALEEYAFINAHKLRSPVASILGLINLLHKTNLDSEAAVIHQHLSLAADELDNIVRSITQAIERAD